MSSADSSVSPRSFFKNDRLLLFALSVLSLYIEIMLIRHLSSEIRIFAYFKNLALIGAFLGLGLGYLYKPARSMMVTAICLVLMALLTHPMTGFARVSKYLSIGDVNIWTSSSQGWLPFIMGLVILTILFFLIIITMIPMGQALAKIFDRSKNRIVDYSINIAGSLVGVWLFAWISFSSLPPLVWYLLALGAILTVWRWDTRQTVSILVLSAIALTSLAHMEMSTGGIVKWSPYQKIIFKKEQTDYMSKEGRRTIDYYALNTNNTIYMFLLDLSIKFRRQHPSVFPPKYDRYLYYDLPYNFPRHLDDVLVLGSGAGNDVAAAIRAGSKQVTAVEIDPRIISFGKIYHQEKPYSAPNVTIVNNDARNYLRETDKKFDLIVLGLLDSHTLTSSFSNTNLDSYMYTLESIGEMKQHLKKDGVLTLAFQLARPWLGAKIFRMIEQQFGRAPIVIHYPSTQGLVRGTGGTYFIASLNETLVLDKVKTNHRIKRLAGGSIKYTKSFLAIQAEPQTDDWPYLYIQKKAIPPLHMIVSTLLIGIFLLIYLYLFRKPGATDYHFAALGAGFLLLEVSVISRFALFWGATWIVSSIVITLILISILAANGLFLWLNRKIDYRYLYAGLTVMLVSIYFIPLESNLVVLVYFAPFTLIGFIFAQSFDAAPIGSRALAFNLFGALVGGLSESLSYVSGLSSLILLALCFYIISGLFLIKRA
jgi:spermidine synthase